MIALRIPVLLGGLFLVAAPAPQSAMTGRWRAVLDIAGGQLPFELAVTAQSGGLVASICNGPKCADQAAVTVSGGRVLFDIADYAATITAERRGDSLIGVYQNVGRNGPRSIPFRARRGAWPRTGAPAAILGSWDAWYVTDQRRSPRVLHFTRGAEGLEGAITSNTGDLGMFWGGGTADSFSVARFDGVSVYLMVGRLTGDTLRGVFHAGLRTQTPFVAVRTTGAPHLTAPTALTSADTSAPFRFSFPDLEGRLVSQTDSRLAGKVVLVDIFGSWCVTCHEATPDLLDLYRDYKARGFEILGLGYEVTGDSTKDNPQIRRFRDKFSIPWILLHAGASVVEETAASLPQLRGFTAYPTTLFLGRDGRIREVYAGFRGPATGVQHTRQIEDYRSIIERLLAEKP
jgi:thiol-disulfide isomerase/thioredoxin